MIIERQMQEVEFFIPLPAFFIDTILHHGDSSSGLARPGSPAPAGKCML
jgi:hypothetical protein